MENGWHPKLKLGNPNVPRDANVIGSTVSMSGEIIYTYFTDGRTLFCVGDWKGDRPHKITSSGALKLK